VSWANLTLSSQGIGSKLDKRGKDHFKKSIILPGVETLPGFAVFPSARIARAMGMDVTDFVAKILAALAMGLVIGIERQLGQHPAGVRTNSLVCLGAALFVSLSVLEPNGQTRIVAQVVSAGFTNTTTYSLGRDTVSSKAKILSMTGNCPTCGLAPSTTFEYNNPGGAHPLLPSAMIDGRLIRTEYTYDGNGRTLTRKENVVSGAPQRTTTYIYDTSFPGLVKEIDQPSTTAGQTRKTLMTYNATTSVMTSRTTKVIRRFGTEACAPLLASYGLPEQEAQRVTRFAERHKSTRSLRRRLRLEFRIRAGLLDAVRGQRPLSLPQTS
jgi:hypothetical protein